MRPSSALHEQFDRFLDLALIRIALFDYGDGNAVRAENDFGRSRVGESRQGLVDFLDQRLQVEFVTIEGLNAMDRDIFPKPPLPLVQAAAGRGAGILRIKRKEHHLVASGRAKLFDGFAR